MTVQVSLLNTLPMGSTPATANGGTKPPPKAINVFSNDGSFLDRFYRTRKEEEEKKKQEELLRTKRNFENRFKNRGKRPSPSESPSEDSYSRSSSAAASSSSSSTSTGRGEGGEREPSAKKVKVTHGDGGKLTTKYEREKQKLTPDNDNNKPRMAGGQERNPAGGRF